MRLVILGLDCLGPEVLDPASRSFMPRLAALRQQGLGGVLQSVLPPITVPAWSCMLTGRDPGELGLYGFKNRSSPSRPELVRANARWMRSPRLWEELDSARRPTITVGMPLTSPVAPLRAGHLVCGFEGALDGPSPWWPETLGEDFDELKDYRFDIQEFRHAALEEAADLAAQMTLGRFRLFRRLLRERPWELATLHEIAPDRMHHLFWRDHDPQHPRHQPGSPFADAIVDYYRLLDQAVGELVDELPPETAVLVASDHGATAMHGAVCLNEILLESGLLRLRRSPEQPHRLSPQEVDWQHTRAWAAGGYFGRIFLNLRGREREGTVPRSDAPALLRELRDLFGELELGDGRVLHNRVVSPGEIYRRVRGIPPDLMIFFAGERWRAVSTVGHRRRWMEGNDQGVDHANHSRDGIFALRVPGREPNPWTRASLLDIAPTLRPLLRLPADPSLQGHDLLNDLRRAA
ncbi:MAG: alkaline phosphatase family protein [Acidobacteriota bacterium]